MEDLFGWDDEKSEYTIEEVNATFKHAAQELEKMRPHDAMIVFETRIAICNVKLEDLASRSNHYRHLLDLYATRQKKMKQEGHGPKSIGVTITKAMSRKARDDSKEVTSLKIMYRNMLNDALQGKQKVIKAYGNAAQE